MPTYRRNRRFSRENRISRSGGGTPYRSRTSVRSSTAGSYSKPGAPYSRRTNPVQAKQQAGYRKRQQVKKRGSAVKGAENRLKNFRQATILAVAITGFMLTLFSAESTEVAAQDSPQQEQVMDTASTADTAFADTVAEDTSTLEETVPGSSKESADEAIGALQNLWNNFYFNLPKILIAIGILVLAWLTTRLLRLILHRTIGRWSRSNAITTLILISVWILAVGIAVSVVAGDIRALVGSFGLIGLALSWSLQTPIESFTGWLLNSFQGYYRVGDRIRVGEVFGDVFRIDFLTTTVWEIGAPYQPGFVQAEQPTGRLVTFPNNEILTGTVINLTGDFPYVWDELSVAVANESDMVQAMQVMENQAHLL
ncbi:MAG: mechanosensitive ion channel family protein, partial [Hymenobacteraceae bacterium]|nr:mechanosensitive ion channel family protein [Hymenobacteraceae bacterium]MDX5395571.1 mechanosensitive ion channel family protein [Hymenobacteraceae bacterium]MDX5511623.1 mechanosensitive ion channel family protein [Hymenobacteraceae bacterium]